MIALVRLLSVLSSSGWVLLAITLGATLALVVQLVISGRHLPRRAHLLLVGLCLALGTLWSWLAWLLTPEVRL